MDAPVVEEVVKRPLDPVEEPAAEEGGAATTAAAAAHDESAGAAGAAGEEQPAAAAAQRTLQHSLEAIKLGSLRLAAIVKAQAQKVADAAKAQAQKQAAPASEGGAEAEAPVAAAGAEAATPAATGTTMARLAELGAIARQTSSRLVQSASEGFKRLAVGDPLLALCRSEPHVPQLVLVACTALVAGGGTTTEGVFKEDAPGNEVDVLSARLAGGRPGLIPAGTSPHAVATLLKRFLLGLQAPVMTYHLLPDWIMAAGDVSQVDAIVRKLPPANGNVLRLLLEVCHAISANSATTEMDALALAQVLAPCLAWLPPSLPKVKAAEGAAEEGSEGGAGAVGGAAHRIVPLEGDEATAIVIVLEALINRFPAIYG